MSGVKSAGPSRSAIGVLVLSLGALVAASVVVFREPVRTAKNSHGGAPDQSTKDDAPLKEGYVRVGGVQRPETDLKSRMTPQESVEPKPEEYGESQPVDPDTNDHTRSIAEAFQSGKYAERLTTAIAARPFNRELYKENPQSYLGVVEPGRVFQPAQPGPDVPRLKYASVARSIVEQGGTVPLRVAATPGAPVTFSSFDLGEFQNRLNTITVEADEQGFATGVFRGTPGTIGPVDILTASPLTSGQLRFTVDVVLPKPKG